MAELVKLDRTMKSTFKQISEQGFFDQFSESEFRNESSISGLYSKSRFEYADAYFFRKIDFNTYKITIL